MQLDFYQYKAREIQMNLDDEGTSKWAILNKKTLKVTILEKATRVDIDTWIMKNHEEENPRR